MTPYAGLRRNSRLYVWFRMTAEYMAWMPVFFLYLNQYVSVADVLLLEAIYYLAVVMVEVPSGYFSDVVGRRPTLLGSQLLAVAGLTAFLYGSEFPTYIPHIADGIFR